MISKVIPAGKSFAGICRYLCKDTGRAEVILSEGVREYDYRLLAADFVVQRAQNPGLKSPVQHIILSYYPGEVVGDRLLANIAAEYLEKLGVRNTQFIVVKHNDRQHLHTHIVFNRVDNNGNTIKDSWIGLKGKKIAQSLTTKYGFKKAEQKNLGLTNLKRMNAFEVTRYEIYKTVCELIPEARSIEDLKMLLKERQIELIYKYKGHTTTIQGISFKMREFKYKASEIDRSFSYGKLSIHFSQKQSYRLSEKHKLDANTYKHLSLDNSLLEQLLRSQYMDNHISHDFLHKKRKRKHKGI